MRLTSKSSGVAVLVTGFFLLGGCGGDNAKGEGSGQPDTAGTGASGGGSHTAGDGADAAVDGGAAGGMLDAGADGAAPDASMDAALPPMGVTESATGSCVERCNVQEKVAGCTPAISHEDCTTQCTTDGDSTLSACSDQFQAYYDCSVTDGYRCLLGKVAQKTSACADEQTDLDACNAR